MKNFTTITIATIKAILVAIFLTAVTYTGYSMWELSTAPSDIELKTEAVNQLTELGISELPADVQTAILGETYAMLERMVGGYPTLLGTKTAQLVAQEKMADITMAVMSATCVAATEQGYFTDNAVKYQNIAKLDKYL